MSTPRSIYLFLAVGLVALSQSANIIRIGDAGAVPITFWRLALSLIVLLPLAGKRIATLKDINRVDALLIFIGGLTLSLHFFAWIYAVQKTTVANATLFLCINPIITASAAYLLFGERASKRLLWAILLGVIGIVVLSVNDLNLSPKHIEGDLYALLSSALFTGYFMVGKQVRKKLDTHVYVASIYGISALISLATMLFMDLPMISYNAQTWLCFGLMALIPTAIGHTSLNAALRYMDAGRISTFTLVEPGLAGLVAWITWNEQITPLVLLGYVFIGGSVFMVALEKKPADMKL